MKMRELLDLMEAPPGDEPMRVPGAGQRRRTPLEFRPPQADLARYKALLAKAGEAAEGFYAGGYTSTNWSGTEEEYQAIFKQMVRHLEGAVDAFGGYGNV